MIENPGKPQMRGMRPRVEAEPARAGLTDERVCTLLLERLAAQRGRGGLSPAARTAALELLAALGGAYEGAHPTTRG